MSWAINSAWDPRSAAEIEMELAEGEAKNRDDPAKRTIDDAIAVEHEKGKQPVAIAKPYNAFHPWNVNFRRPKPSAPNYSK